MDYTAIKEQFDRDGVVVVRNFLATDSLDELKSQLDRYIRDIVPNLPDRSAFYHDRNRPETLKQMQHMGRDAWFNDYRKHPQWNELAETLVGEPVEAQEPEWFNKPPGVEHPTPPHQDNFYFCLKPPNVVTIWLALDPVDDENGCLRYVVGSYHGGIRDHGGTDVLGFSQGINDYGPEDEAREMAVHLQPGDAVIHHGDTIHIASPNRSADRQRRGFAMVFEGESCERDAVAYERYQASVRRQHESMGLKTEAAQPQNG